MKDGRPHTGGKLSRGRPRGGPAGGGVGQFCAKREVRLTESRKYGELFWRGPCVEREASQPHQGSFHTEVPGFVVSPWLMPTRMEVIVKNIVVAIDQSAGCGMKIGPAYEHARQFFGQIMPPQGRCACHLLQRLTPPLDADLPKHSLLGAEGAL